MKQNRANRSVQTIGLRITRPPVIFRLSPYILRNAALRGASIFVASISAIVSALSSTNDTRGERRPHASRRAQRRPGGARQAVTDTFLDFVRQPRTAAKSHWHYQRQPSNCTKTCDRSEKVNVFRGIEPRPSDCPCPLWTGPRTHAKAHAPFRASVGIIGSGDENSWWRIDPSGSILSSTE